MNAQAIQEAQSAKQLLPSTFVLELTRRCNNRCGYCYNAWRAPELKYAKEDRGEMTTEEIKETILRLEEEAPVAVVALSGGEPTLRPDLPEIVQFIRSRGILAQIVTNGTNLTKSLVDATVNGSVYQISLRKRSVPPAYSSTIASCSFRQRQRGERERDCRGGARGRSRQCTAKVSDRAGGRSR